MEWPDGVDITKDMEANCKQYMTSIMDGESHIPNYYVLADILV